MSTFVTDNQDRLNASMVAGGLEVPTNPNVVHLFGLTDAAVANLELHVLDDRSTEEILETTIPTTVPIEQSNATDIARVNVGNALSEAA